MSKRKLLVVLDLNGTLVDRLTKQHERKMASQNALCPKYSDLTLERCRVFLRPYLDVFLQFLLDNFHVAVWTSAVAKNAHPMTEFIMEPFGGAEALEFVWDRDQCILDPIPKKAYNTIKDLRLIWREAQNPNLSNNETFDDTLPDANLSMPFTSSHVWDETNTILLDDSASKSCRTPLNHLLIPTFSVWDLTATPNCDQDTTLLATMSYLKSLLKSHDDEMSFTGSISDGAAKAAWSVQEFLTQTPLYVATPEEKIKLVSEIHAAGFVEESMLQQRHRGGGDKELLGKTPFTVFDEWRPRPSDSYIDRTADRAQWTDDKRYSVKKPNAELDDERAGRTHNRWTADYQGGPSDGVVQSDNNQKEYASAEAPNGPSGEDALPSEARLSRRAIRRLRKEAAQQKAQVANGTQVVESTILESNKSAEVVEGKEENEVGTGAPRVKRKRPKKKREWRMNYEAVETPLKKKRQASPAGVGEGGSGQDDRSIFSICSAM
ncbi:HAD-like domain-containing protein [Chytriomyces cf. hyalinus JEL632]|nr:HAD-like domain-containing protein [Chytriomyces cf. hyalinus JEL632]